MPSHEDDGESRSPVTYAEQFEALFPSYLAMGMTPEQYWDGDSTLVKAFRQAEEIRQNKRNQELWLQGLYIYDALSCVSPLLHAFAKKGTKAVPYPEKPYALTRKARARDKEDKERRIYEKGKRNIEALMASFNKRFRKKEEQP